MFRAVDDLLKEIQENNLLSIEEMMKNYQEELMVLEVSRENTNKTVDNTLAEKLKKIAFAKVKNTYYICKNCININQSLRELLDYLKQKENEIEGIKVEFHGRTLFDNVDGLDGEIFKDIYETNKKIASSIYFDSKEKLTEEIEQQLNYKTINKSINSNFNIVYDNAKIFLKATNHQGFKSYIEELHNIEEIFKNK